MTEEVIDAEVEEIGTAVAVLDSTPPVLLSGATPAAKVESATEMANALAGIIDGRKLFKEINGKKFVFVEGWTTLGSLMGVFPIVEWTRPTPDAKGWEARVVARTMNGAEVGAGESMCSRSESKWKNADDNAIRSMAQTRATSKALRLPLGFVMQLAGYEATPEPEVTERVEEMKTREEQTRPTTWPGLLASYEEKFGKGAGWPEWWTEAATRACDVRIPPYEGPVKFANVIKLATDEQKAKLWKGLLAALDMEHSEIGPTRAEIRAGFAKSFEGIALQGPMISLSPDEADILPTYEMFLAGDNRPANEGSGSATSLPSAASAADEGTSGKQAREDVPAEPEQQSSQGDFPSGY